MMDSYKRKKIRSAAHRILRTALAVLIAAVCVLLLGIRIYFVGSISPYYRAVEKEFVIPGLWDGFIPQGVTYDEDNDIICMTGYSADGKGSPLYVIENSNRESIRRLTLLQENGATYDGHSAGAAVYGDYVYVAGYDSHLYAYSREAVVNASDGDSIPCEATIPVGSENGELLNAGTVTVMNGYLVVGEFYRAESDETPESHWIETKNGTNRALAVVYNASDGPDSVGGLDLTPVLMYSLPDMVQGMAGSGEMLYLSTSYGLAFSKIAAYDNALMPQQTFSFNGKNVPLYTVDERSMTGSMKTPPMSEEIELIDGRLYTACESASNKYVFGKFTSGQFCYSLDPKMLEKVEGEQE